MAKDESMTDIALIGLLAGLLTTGSQVPQAIKVYRTKSTGDLSSYWISILLIGTIVWLIYGLMISDLPLIVWNTISIFTLSYISLYKFNIIDKNGIAPITYFVKQQILGNPRFKNF